MPENLPGIVLAFVMIAYSIVLHELGHGFAAKWFGDDTGTNQGRLTFNPVDHVDLLGTIILPVLQLLTLKSVYLGWARPMVVNTHKLEPRIAGEVVVSLAGITMNMAVAVAMAILAGLPIIPNGSQLQFAVLVTLYMNVSLTVFNLLPFPPLDGSRLLRLALPDGMRSAFDRVGVEGFIILLVLSYSGILNRLIDPPREWIAGGLIEYLSRPIARALS